MLNSDWLGRTNKQTHKQTFKVCFYRAYNPFFQNRELYVGEVVTGFEYFHLRFA
jgi:hypothetical protein